MSFDIFNNNFNEVPQAGVRCSFFSFVSDKMTSDLRIVKELFIINK